MVDKMIFSLKSSWVFVFIPLLTLSFSVFANCSATAYFLSHTPKREGSSISNFRFQIKSEDCISKKCIGWISFHIGYREDDGDEKKEQRLINYEIPASKSDVEVQDTVYLSTYSPDVVVMDVEVGEVKCSIVGV